MANSLKINVDKIPSVNTNDFDSFIKSTVRKGFTNKQYLTLKRNGNLKGINEQAVTISNSLSNISSEIKTIESQIKNIKKINSPSKDSKKKEVKKFLFEASQHLTNSFKKISTVNFIKDIEVLIGELTEVSFEIKVTLDNGKTVSKFNF